MKKLLTVILFGTLASCTTIHFRSKNTVPVSFDGNPDQQKEVSLNGKRDFYFWGLNPDHHDVFIDEEVRHAGYEGLSKVIIYEQKSAQEILISFLTFGIYLPRSFIITGFASDKMLPAEEPVKPIKK